jgi:hypothetical protein
VSGGPWFDERYGSAPAHPSPAAPPPLHHGAYAPPPTSPPSFLPAPPPSSPPLYPPSYQAPVPSAFPASAPASAGGVLFFTPSRPPRRSSRLLAVLLTGVVAVAVVSGGRWWLSSALPSSGPPAGLEEAQLPLGAPPPESALDTGPYAFSAMQPDGSGPVTYSPCRPIHYVVRPDNAPVGGDVLLQSALDSVARATGLQFVADGATDEAPDPDRAAYQPDRYGRRWAPVLIAWSTATETPDLAGDVAGTGGSASLTHDGRATYVTGAVTIDAEELNRLLGTANGTRVATGVITHELGHLVGLAHVDDAAQLMYPRTNLTVTSFAAGDRAGLALLGSGECARDV